MSVPAIYVSGSNRSAAMEYNFGRTGRLATLDDSILPIPAMESKVFAALQGLWLASDDRCRTSAPVRHVDNCAHGANRDRRSLAEIARAAFGDDDFDHRRQVRRAIVDDDELGFLAKPQLSWLALGDFRLAQSAAVLAEVKMLRHTKSEAGIVEYRFTPSIHDQLMAGHFQRLHDLALHRLSKGAWTMYREVILQPRVHRLAVGESAEFGVTGRDPAIPIARLGKGRVRADRLHASLDKEAKAISRLSLGLVFSIETRANDGLKIVVSRGATSSHQGDHFEPEGGLVEAERGASSGHESSANPARRRLETVSRQDPLGAALGRAFGQRVKDSQVRLARVLASKHKLSEEAAAEVMLAAIKRKADPLEALRAYVAPSRPLMVLCEGDRGLECRDMALVPSFDSPHPWLCSGCGEIAA